MAECAVCYVADENFLLPSLVAATALRRAVAPDRADIFLFVVDGDAAVTTALERFLAGDAIHVLPLTSREFTGFDPGDFNKTHVPPATLGRFFMEGALPLSCRRILYIDGDTWLAGDPSPLIDAEIPDGRLLAAEDISSFYQHEPAWYGEEARSYLRRLGVPARQGYANAGVFAVTRATWRQIGDEAYRFFRENAALCRHHDQSALNAVIGDRRLRLSVRWNFQTPYRLLGVERQIAPRLYHFTWAAKPWASKAGPWKRFHAPYQRALRPFAPLRLPILRASPRAMARHELDYVKQTLKLRTLARPLLAERRARLAAYESEAWL